MKTKRGPANRAEGRGGRLQGDGLQSLDAAQLRALLKETRETNRLLREAEERERRRTWNALTAGLSGIIRGIKSLREESKLIRELNEEIRQAELEEREEQRSGTGKEKQP